MCGVNGWMHCWSYTTVSCVCMHVCSYLLVRVFVYVLCWALFSILQYIQISWFRLATFSNNNHNCITHTQCILVFIHVFYLSSIYNRLIFIHILNNRNRNHSINATSAWSMYMCICVWHVCLCARMHVVCTLTTVARNAWQCCYTWSTRRRFSVWGTHTGPSLGGEGAYAISPCMDLTATCSLGRILESSIRELYIYCYGSTGVTKTPCLLMCISCVYVYAYAMSCTYVYVHGLCAVCVCVHPHFILGRILIIFLARLHLLMNSVSISLFV